MADPDTERLMAGADTQVRLVAGGQTLFGPGDECAHYVFVRSGSVRVELLSSRGQQLVLYRINSGESCVMTTACLLGTTPCFAQAITETQVDLLLMPAAGFRRRLTESDAFRTFVFTGFSERLAALMQRTAEIASHTIDQRLAAVLLSQSDPAVDSAVALTHQQLAVEIGTVREVVSRRLAVLESRGLIVRQRGQIQILDRPQLTRELAN